MTKFGTLELKNGIAIEKDVIELDLNTLPSTDPLAFGYGVSYGQRCARNKTKIDHGSKHSELAQEYLRGFLVGFRGILVPEGTKIKKEQETNYSLSSLNLIKNQ